MLKETPGSLRAFFGVLAFLYAIIFAGRAAQVILLLREKPHAQISILFIVDALFILMVAIAFGWVFARFWRLLLERSNTIKAIVHVNFWGSVLFGAIYLIAGTHVNFFGLTISTIVYIYLLNSVTRLSVDASDAPSVQPAAPDQPP